MGKRGVELSAGNIVRFHNKYLPEPNSGCWLWMKSHDREGYGHFWWRKRLLRAHRVMWTIENGPIPPKLHVLHKCDVPACVNPDHLWLGTDQDNLQDSIKKGRAACVNGKRPNPWQRIPKETIRQIRQSSGTRTAIAKKFGVSLAYVSQLQRGFYRRDAD